MRTLEPVVAPSASTGSNRPIGREAAAAANSTGNGWGPFRNAATYGADMAIVVGILLFAFVLGLLLMASVKFLVRRRRGVAQSPPAGDPEKRPGGKKTGGALLEGPPTVYAAGETELAGAAADCAICLTEFAEGDALRVLPACRHGFHAECVETWLASSAANPSKSSVGAPPCCPICRASCRPPARSPASQP